MSKLLENYFDLSMSFYLKYYIYFYCDNVKSISNIYNIMYRNEML